MGYVLGIDLGTSSMKGILVDKKGQISHTSTEVYDSFSLASGYSEQHPEDWVNALNKIAKEMADFCKNLGSTIKGISLSGQMHSLVLVDEEGAVLRPSILWNDVRTTQECEMINESLNILEITSNKALEGFTLTKVLWVQKHEPEIWDKVHKIMVAKDYIIFYLTGIYNMEYSDASGTLLFDSTTQNWSLKVLEKFGINRSKLPILRASHDSPGNLKEILKKKFGIKYNIPIFSGAADNAAAALGSGVVQNDQALLSIGTSGVFLAPTSSSDAIRTGDLHLFNHAVPGKLYNMGVTLSAGSSLSWLNNTFAKKMTFVEMSNLISDVKAGSNGLIYTPYIYGERTPHTDSKIRGSFIGIDSNHELKHFIKSVMEGVVFSLKESYEIMLSEGKKFEGIVSVGGGAKSKEWLQIQADIFNLQIRTLKTEEGPALGAAIIAAVGVGWFDTFDECIKEFVNFNEEIITPNRHNVKIYKSLFDIYKSVYSRTKDINDQLIKYRR